MLQGTSGLLISTFRMNLCNLKTANHHKPLLQSSGKLICLKEFKQG